MKNIETLKKEFEDQFGTSLNARQLWALVKFAKHVRLRCRNNAAFNNFCNAFFNNARFSQVTKQRPNRYNPSQLENYPGLQISVAGQEVDGDWVDGED
jgi:hypothetical protein